MQIENLLNPIIQRVIYHIKNKKHKNNKNTIYSDSQNVHSSSIQKSIRNSINNLMNAYIVEYPLTPSFIYLKYISSNSLSWIDS